MILVSSPREFFEFFCGESRDGSWGIELPQLEQNMLQLTILHPGVSSLYVSKGKKSVQCKMI